MLQGVFPTPRAFPESINSVTQGFKNQQSGLFAKNQNDDINKWFLARSTTDIMVLITSNFWIWSRPHYWYHTCSLLNSNGNLQSKGDETYFIQEGTEAQRLVILP